jgi:multisubunit Na+/H+ antiporter MnhC subunit
MIVYLLCFVLFLVGLYGVTHPEEPGEDRHLAFHHGVQHFPDAGADRIHRSGSGSHCGSRGSGAQVYVDPLPQAMVLTAIVIGLATTAMLMAIAIRLYRKYNTFDIREIKNLKRIKDGCTGTPVCCHTADGCLPGGDCWASWSTASTAGLPH